MDPKSIDNSGSLEIMKLKEEVALLQKRVQFLQRKINDIQHRCKHIFWESSSIRKCQKCGYTESTYY